MILTRSLLHSTFNAMTQVWSKIYMWDTGSWVLYNRDWQAYIWCTKKTCVTEEQAQRKLEALNRIYGSIH